MAKIEYSEYLKKLPVSTLVAESIFSDLSSSCALYKISKLCKTSSGGTPLRSKLEFYNGDIPWLKSGELNDGLITTCNEFITEFGLKNSSAKLHAKGSILLAMYGATAGRVGILDFEASTNQAVCAIFPDENKLDKEFLYWFLRQHRYRFIEISKGGAQPNISQKVINDTLIPVPSITLQRELVILFNDIEKNNKLDIDLIPTQFRDKVNSLFYSKNNVEIISTELKNQINIISKLRQAFLREAMRGELVSNETSDGKTGANLLQEIQAEKEKLIKEKKIKKSKPLPTISEDEIPFEIPQNWAWCRLGELSQNIVYGTSTKTKDDGEVPVFRMGNITTDGKLLLSNLKYTDSDIADLPSLYLQEYDLLFNRTNSFELVGKSAVFNEVGKFTCASYLIIVRFSKKNHFPNFICKYINSKVCRITQLEPNIIQQNGQANFNGTKLANILIPLPPMEVINRLNSKLDSLMKYCNELEKSIRESQNYNEQLLQQVLREALEGKDEVENENLQLVAEESPIYSIQNTINKNCDTGDMAILAGYIIKKLSTQNIKDFGRVKLQKMLHLLEYHCQLSSELKYQKNVAGPYAWELEHVIEPKLKSLRFFEIKKDKFGATSKVTYTPLSASNELPSLFNREFKNQAESINNLLDKFQDKNWEFCEMISTMYAVWNNRLINKELFTDEILKQDFLAWDDKKKRFIDQLDYALDWIRKEKIEPVGFGDYIDKK
ncbi:restriction endonuclease subunit S [Chryseobacterium oranimense]|uniref:restriction endonuclease subunit S n=1 Tax=Chryseobacterium oranimense TaxID=421058 RepID=UPI0021B04375|nr:restriction endonuclease subunit S [Chryseobacterium oranimense]UWX59140.1 restriction endonuclease subunit S [Chryseobacterium oranimense]